MENAQVVFVDTPGMHLVKKELVCTLNEVAKSSLADVELILYMVDVSRRVGEEELSIMRYLLNPRNKIIMVFNKIDLGSKYLSHYMETWQQLLKKKGLLEDPVCYYIPVSAVTQKNLDKLKQSILASLPEQPAFYEPGTVTDFPLKFRIADIIREKLFLHLKEELPHNVAVVIDEMRDKKDIFRLKATIHVNSASQKAIVIGRGGEFIKNTGIAARRDLESILGKQVYLELKVDALKDWQKSPRILRELGYTT
jgi:GTP-binding protein Era